MKDRTAIQLSAADDRGRPILSVIAKRTYRIEGGRCVLAEAQLPLNFDPIPDPNARELLIADADIFPFKPMTDVVVSGHAHNHSQRAVFETLVHVGAIQKRLVVHGNRRATIASSGRVLYSEPSLLDELPLSYAFAYGGCDLIAERAYGNPAELLAPYGTTSFSPEMVAAASPFRYPRNPCGRGYVIEPSPEAVDAIALPNFEDPADPLHPDRLLLLDSQRWPLQPIPAGYGWLDYGWFPRIAWFGIVPDYDPTIEPHAVAEIRDGHCPSTVLEETGPSLRCANGASLGLSLPHLTGDEAIELINLHPRFPQLSFRLPGERPRISVDGREGRLIETDPVIHTVHIDPTHDRVNIVWRGCAIARRVYLDEIATMPFAVEWPC